MRYIHGAHMAPMWQLGTHWDPLSYMECMFPCWGTWKLLHGMPCSHMETHVAHLHTNACSQMETHVAHLHMMHVPTWEVCPHVPMLGLGVCSQTWEHWIFPNVANTFQSFCDTSCSCGAYGAIGNALGTFIPTWEHMFPCWGNNAIDYICGSDRIYGTKPYIQVTCVQVTL